MCAYCRGYSQFIFLRKKITTISPCREWIQMLPKMMRRTK